MTDEQITLSTSTGLDPIVMAQRVLRGIKDRKFYLLAIEYWNDIAVYRLDEIREESNPILYFPENAGI